MKKPKSGAGNCRKTWWTWSGQNKRKNLKTNYHEESGFFYKPSPWISVPWKEQKFEWNLWRKRYSSFAELIMPLLGNRKFDYTLIYVYPWFHINHKCSCAPRKKQISIIPTKMHLIYHMSLWVRVLDYRCWRFWMGDASIIGCCKVVCKSYGYRLP